jgi:hypothetical protein
LGDLFRRWQAEKKSFVEFFETEKAGYQNVLLRGIEEDQQQAAQMASLFTRLGSPVPRSVSRFMATLNTPLMIGLKQIVTYRELEKVKNDAEFEEAYERSDDLAPERVIAFIKSGAMNETPANVTAALMYAALARRAVAGQRKVPDEGTATDIRIVSTLLPYCDAMFVDNGCRSLLNEIPQSHKLPYHCKVFSSKTSDDFLQYLRDIRNSATPEHIEQLHQVYGDDVLKPPTSIYGVGERKRDAEPPQ